MTSKEKLTEILSVEIVTNSRAKYYHLIIASSIIYQLLDPLTHRLANWNKDT